MKKMLLLGLMLTASAFAQINPPATPIPNATELAKVAKADPIGDLTKELGDVKAQLANVQAQAAQTSVAAEYYKAVAERNDAFVKVLQLQGELAQTKQALIDAQARIADLEKKAAPPPAAPVPSATKPPTTK